ncbi:RNA polymerase ECF-type sigma factor [Steroidobacter agaridevorans]|uniref:RNA polymerase ECF-type sigma factor n=1 Tax=Steroidobacter agaridevorans TaxID=2695856 RepID=A0A829YC12_9GAMM|nr:sigma-70 family RNA polymerase sigma factor [Steroidobacter agaridevorans]GFE80142.1 RNA polymerase ECF-type sigma factor [Steroidobacter agaridevorans]
MQDRTKANEKLATLLGDAERPRWFLRHILPHEAMLRRWLARKRAPDLDIDDIIQESYAVLAKRERVDDIVDPRAYLFQVAHSLVVRNIRRARIVSIQAVDDLELCDYPDEAPTPEQNAIARDELQRLAEVIATMPGQTREAFILRRVRGMRQRDIAARMGLSESTVEKHIARGLRWLADWFVDGGKPVAETSKKMGRKQRRPDGRTGNQPER